MIRLMNTANIPDPTPSPSKPSVSPVRHIISWVLLIAVLAAVGIVVYMRFFRHVKISDTEIVRFTGSATRSDAKKVGAGLTKGHFFDGETPGEAIIDKNASGFTLTLVTNDPPMPFHESAAAEVARQLGADSIVLRYSDEKGKIGKEVNVKVPKGVPDDREIWSVQSTQPVLPSTRPNRPGTRPVR